MSDRKAAPWSGLVTPFALIEGTPGPDVLDARADGDVVRGLGGDDELASRFNFTELYGGDGDDRLRTNWDFLVPGESPQTYRFLQSGDAGDDVLYFRVGLRPLVSDDLFFEADLEARLSGGLGNDVLSAYFNLGSLAGGVTTAVLSGGAGDDRLTSTLETPRGVAAADFTARLYGGDGDDRIEASAGSDSLLNGISTNRVWGGAGDDEIEAFAYSRALGRGNSVNEIDGGSGNDWIRATTDVVTNVGVNAQRNTIGGGAGDDVIEAGHVFGSNGSGRIDNLVEGSGGHDRVTVWIDQKNNWEQYGLEAFNQASGGPGNDVLRARIEAVVYERLTAENRLTGGSGNDVLRAEITVSFESGEGNVLASRNLLSGGTGNDRLTVVGGLSNLLHGGQGGDVMTGGTGDDTYRVDSYLDRAVEASGASGGTDAVISWVSHRLSAGIENLTLLAGVRGVGNGLANGLTGSAADDRLVGLGGADRFVGRGGTDSLEGGAGADRFVVDLRAGASGVLILADFERAADVFEIVGLADEGAPGLLDDLDALAEFDDAGPGGLLEVELGGIVLRLPGRGTGAVDSFADIVANPATQLQGSADLLM